MKVKEKKTEYEIDLIEIFQFVFSRKWIILFVTIIFSVVSILYSSFVPEVYKSEVIAAPNYNTGANEIGGQASTLAALAGIELTGGGDNKVDQAIALLKSWYFLDEFIVKFQLKPILMAAHKWDVESKETYYHPSLFDINSNHWKTKVDGKTLEPSSWETYEKFKDSINVSEDSRTGFLKVSIVHKSPYVARDLCVLLIDELNSRFQKEDIRDANANIAYLEKKVSETSVSDLKGVFYSMIETETQKAMLAEVSSEYLFKVVVHPMVAEKPNNSKLVYFVFYPILAFSITTIFFIIMYFVSTFKNHRSLFQ